MTPGRFEVPRQPVVEAPPVPSLPDGVEPLVEAAGRVKAELNRQIRKLYDEDGRVRERRVFRILRRERELYAIREYLPAINGLRALGTETLQAAREVLLARLERGWAMQGLDESGLQLFGDLLCQYEAIEDALSDDALSRTLNRLNTIEQAVR